MVIVVIVLVMIVLVMRVIVMVVMILYESQHATGPWAYQVLNTGAEETRGGAGRTNTWEHPRGIRGKEQLGPLSHSRG